MTLTNKETGALRAVVSEAVEDGVHVAKRALKRGIHRVEDIRDAAGTRVRREPLTMLGVALGVGLVLGAAGAWIGARMRTRERTRKRPEWLSPEVASKMRTLRDAAIQDLLPPAGAARR